MMSSKKSALQVRFFNATYKNVTKTRIKVMTKKTEAGGDIDSFNIDAFKSDSTFLFGLGAGICL